MRRLAGIGLVCVLSGSGGLTAAPEEVSAVAGSLAYDPVSAYQEQTLLGWRVWVNQKLIAQTNLCRRTLELLQAQLVQITNVIPAVPLRQLRDISFWVERSSALTPCAAYHQSYEWLRTHGVNPAKTGAVEIGSPEHFLEWTHEQPWMVLHELAHGYHKQFLGENHPGIRRCYEAAKAGGKYDSVWHGQRRQRHYALTNDKEYFAECTEAFFGRNDFQPYTREELRSFDPEMYQLLFQLWNLPDPPP